MWDDREPRSSHFGVGKIREVNQQNNPFQWKAYFSSLAFYYMLNGGPLSLSHCCASAPLSHSEKYHTHEILGCYSVTQHKRVLCHILVTFEWIYSYLRLRMPHICRLFRVLILAARSVLSSCSSFFVNAFASPRITLSHYILDGKSFSTKDKRWSTWMERNACFALASRACGSLKIMALPRTRATQFRVIWSLTKMRKEKFRMKLQQLISQGIF